MPVKAGKVFFERVLTRDSVVRWLNYLPQTPNRGRFLPKQITAQIPVTSVAGNEDNYS